jgi:hypothetical protein
MPINDQRTSDLVILESLYLDVDLRVYIVVSTPVCSFVKFSAASKRVDVGHGAHNRGTVRAASAVGDPTALDAPFLHAGGTPTLAGTARRISTAHDLRSRPRSSVSELSVGTGIYSFLRQVARAYLHVGC